MARNWFVYRIPSVAAGVGTIVLAALFARRWGRFEAFAAALMTSESFMLIVYSSEARGYALCGFFAIAAALALDRFLAAPNRWTNVAFCLATILGFLSHLTFLSVYAGAFAWSVYALWRNSKSPQEALMALLRLHTAPILFVAALYWIDIRFLGIGGGQAYDLQQVLASTSALAIGAGAESAPWMGLFAVVAWIAGVAALMWMMREATGLAIFFLVAVVIAPALLLILKRPPALYERYFYVNVVFSLLLFSYLLGRMARWNAVGRVAAVSTLILMTVGNSLSTEEFLRNGRGRVLELLEYVAATTPPGDIRLAGEQGFNEKLYVGFYIAYLPQDRSWFYYDNTSDVPVAPEWLIRFDNSRPFAPPQEISDLRRRTRDRYVLQRFAPTSRLTGYNAAIYRRADLAK